MSPNDRKEQMEKYIEQNLDVSVTELTEHFNISTMTAWRDLKDLETRGIIIRKHGRVMHINAISNISEPQFSAKQSLYSLEKELISKYAVAHFVEDNDIIVLEGGTTIAHMVPHLHELKVTLLTNGLDVMNLVSEHCPQINLMSSGGLFRHTSRTFVSSQAETFFQKVNSSKFFFSATGLTIEDGVTDPNPLEIDVKRAMAKSAQLRVLLLTSDKFGIRSLSEIIPLQEIDHIVTDAGAPQEAINKLEQYNIQIHVVPTI